MRVNHFLGLIVLSTGLAACSTPDNAPPPASTAQIKPHGPAIGIDGYNCPSIALTAGETCAQACAAKGIDASNPGSATCAASGDCMLIVTSMNQCQCCNRPK